MRTDVERRVALHGGEEIGDVLLHQEVMAGVGNEFKSEICFVTGVNPFCRVRELRPGEIAALIASSVRLVKANVLEDSGETMVTYGGTHRRTTQNRSERAGMGLWARG